MKKKGWKVYLENIYSNIYDEIWDSYRFKVRENGVLVLYGYDELHNEIERHAYGPGIWIKIEPLDDIK